MPNFATLPVRFKTIAIAAVAATASIAVFSTAPVAAHHHSAKKQQANIVQTAVGTGVHETLVAAVQAAGLVDTLSGSQDFTVFAPTDTAFAKLPDGTVATLVKPENKATLTGILTYHVVAGRVTSDQLINLIERHSGEASISTISGGKLTARLSGDTIVITDAKGGSTAVTTADVRTSNGIIHVTDGVFLPG
ncbi:MAG: fasciclin domain-containing protein [Erythrobacter sp.]